MSPSASLFKDDVEEDIVEDVELSVALFIFKGETVVFVSSFVLFFSNKADSLSIF